jgi:hypothetical protein
MSSQLPGTSGPASGSSTPPVSTSSAAPAGTGGQAGSPPPSGSTGGPDRDWTVEVTERVESVVGTIRDKTTVPITKIARAVVFGLLVLVVAVVVLVAAIDALVRIIDVYLPFDPYARRVWIGYAGLGAIFLMAGAFCWSKRTRKPQEKHQ